tara:strand:- start:498 stop:656 length:159 start_codon:yes stop_codon:yes gene_type:complete
MFQIHEKILRYWRIEHALRQNDANIIPITLTAGPYSTNLWFEMFSAIALGFS